MSGFFTLAFKNPKTSLSGILSFLMVTGGYLAGWAVQHQSPFWIKVGAGASFVSGLSKVYIGLISKDAGTQLATVPGSDTPQAVPSHEVPDARTDKPVTKN
jgi:hypothetical protein